MFVRYMTADEWYDRADHGINVASPTWGDVEAAISSLDGIRRTLVSICDKSPQSSQYMLIAGQWSGRCLVNATKDNREFYSLFDSTRSTKKILLYVGGQEGDFEERKCVPVGWALEAAEHFFRTGELKPTMSWLSDRA
jgi:hypothetical protein